MQIKKINNRGLIRDLKIQGAPHKFIWKLEGKIKFEMKILFVILYIIVFLVAFVLIRKENYFWKEFLVGDFIIAAVWPLSLVFFIIVGFMDGLDWIVRKLFDRWRF